MWVVEFLLDSLMLSAKLVMGFIMWLLIFITVETVRVTIVGKKREGD